MIHAPLEKLRAVAPTDSNNKFDSPGRLTINAADGSVVKGHCTPYADATSVIRGVASIGGGYKLLVDLDLGRAGEPLFKEIEFK